MLWRKTRAQGLIQVLVHAIQQVISRAALPMRKDLISYPGQVCLLRPG